MHYREKASELCRKFSSSRGNLSLKETMFWVAHELARGKLWRFSYRPSSGCSLRRMVAAIESIWYVAQNGRQSALIAYLVQLVISPTRELASQIYEESRFLTSAVRSLDSQVVFGGTSKVGDYRALERRIPNILVGTPGRLIDHIEQTTIRGRPFKKYLDQVSTVVLDETDRLLDMGFRDDISRILQSLPHRGRQTLLFSATIPSGVKTILRQNLSPDFTTVDCVQDHDPASHTNEKVVQNCVLLGNDDTVRGTVDLIMGLIRESNENKIIVFFPTSQMVIFFSKLFRNHLHQNVLEIHAKKSQDQRTSASNKYRKMKGGVMFTSDVSARGVDYPGVTHVVQFGMADSRETYIHRLGRTGRANNKGTGILILSPMEKPFLQTLSGLDIQTVDVDDVLSRPMEGNALGGAVRAISSGRDEEIKQLVDRAYVSVLGFYSSKVKSLPGQNRSHSSRAIVQYVNGFARQMGLQEMPIISSKIAAQVGLAGVDGLNCGPSFSSNGRSQRTGDYRGGAGSQRYNDGGNRNRFNSGTNQNRHNSGSNRSRGGGAYGRDSDSELKKFRGRKAFSFNSSGRH